MTGVRGYVLLPVLLAIAVIGAIAYMLSQESTLEVNRTRSGFEAAKAEYVAQAGLQHALRETAQQGCGGYNDLINVDFGSDQYSSTLTTDLGPTTNYTINVDQDSYIRSDLPTANNASAPNLHVEFLGGVVERPMLRYDLSALPVNAAILSARARFYINSAHPQGPVDIHRLTADWAENDATWDSMNTNMDATVLTSIPTQQVADVWVTVNLTAQVQAWVNGEPNYGITLNTTSEGIHSFYASRESANVPYLEVVVGTPSSSLATLQSVGTLANGVSRTIGRNEITLQQHPDSFLFLQPDASQGKDTYLYEWKSTWNYGVSNQIWADDEFSDSTAIGLIRFDVGAVPNGARITAARLELYQASPSLDGGPIGIYRLVNDWDEGIGSGSAGASNWNQRNAINNWTSPGGDFTAIRYALQTVPAGIGWSSWEISDLVDGWVSGRFANVGLALFPETAGAAAHFASSDATDPTLRPKLSITYTCACGEVCITPQGSGNVLLVVADPAALLGVEVYKKEMIESWGYTVNLIDDNATQASFGTALAANDVVYISASVASGAVGDKLTNATIGVVNEEGALDSIMGFASTQVIPVPVGDRIDITDNSHYITQPFPAGSLKIYTADMGGHAASGALAAGLQGLANWGTNPGLAILDTGAPLGGDVVGVNAKGRRVLVPFGQDNTHDWSKLNNNGRLLMQRALQWGAGSISGPPDINVLFVVPDATSLGPQDTTKQALMESWGFSVTSITAAESQANFDTAVASADVVYISEEAASADTNTKLRDATIGVVNEETALTDEFGISSSHTGYSGTDIEVVDNTHYITSGFPIGPLAIASSATALDRRSGALAPGLDALAQTAGNPELAIIDTGGQLYDTGAASGRRVQLPWGTDDFDINLLTADGLTVMRRALEWGAGSSAPTAPIAHWKLDETSGPTAVDSEGGHHGTWTNGPAAGTGVLDGALVFDGSNDFIDVPHDDKLLLTQAMTFTAWANTLDNGGGYRAIISKDIAGNGASNYWFGIEDDELVFGFWAAGSFRAVKTSAVNLASGSWYHLVASFDNATDVVRLYVNGSEVQVGSITFEPTTESADLFIGHSVDGEYWNGRLDDVRIYDRRLTASEISVLADEGGSGVNVDCDVDTAGTYVEAENYSGTIAGINGLFTVESTTAGFNGSGYLRSNGGDTFTPPRTEGRTYDLNFTETGIYNLWIRGHAIDGFSDSDFVGFNGTEFGQYTTNGIYNQWLWSNSVRAGGSNQFNVAMTGVQTITIWVREQDMLLDGIYITKGSEAPSGGIPAGVKIVDPGSCGGDPTVFESSVANGNDDAEERVSNGSVNGNSTDLELVTDGSNNQLVGIRFTNVTVPNGATISSAYIQFQVDETNSGATSVNIQGQAIDDAPTFTTGNSSNISSRNRTSATVPWAPEPWTTAGEAGPDQRTPDIATVIQEIIDRPGWVSGNDLVIIMSGSGERTAESYDGDSNAAALLHIEY